MKAPKILSRQLKTLSQINRSAKLFLSMTIMHGLFMAGWGLFFNLYILESGFGRDLLGLVNSAAPAAVFLFGLPMGLVSDRIGRKRSLIIGQVIWLLGYTTALFMKSPTLIVAAIFIGGAGDALFIVSISPLLAKLSKKGSRALLFSLNAAFMTLSHMVGSYIGGQMPRWYQNTFGIPASTAENYHAVILTGVILTFLSFIPMFMIRIPQDGKGKDANGKVVEPVDLRKTLKGMQDILRNKDVWKFFLPNLSTGMGAALIVPYFNLFFVEKFNLSDSNLGLIFSLAALLTGVSTLLGPRLANWLGGRIRAVVFTQLTSLIFLLMLGFAPWFGAVAIGFLMRGALMNMVGPLYESFSMEQFKESEQGAFSSIQVLSWELGWAIGPFISGLVQARYGYTPLFVATFILYSLANLMTWRFFRHRDDQQQAPQPLAYQGT